ncbi:MAG: rhodanese-like domain-containing protein [Candidatus Hydrogenedentota bacterium]|nr:MAG: rhodanese-like domain-containing protein [Candidatus Hydrogenedentota bacterium]
MKKIHGIMILFLFSFVACSPAKTQNPAKAEIKSWIEQGALVVDVRTPEEFASGHYPNAKNIPLQELESRISEFGNKDNKIVLYCRSGRRASIAKKILEAAGYKNVVNAGGLYDIQQIK